MVDAEVRIMASELLHQETDSEIKSLLQELMIDESLEGTEAEKNAFLAPAEKVERDEGSLALPPSKEKEIPAQKEVENLVKSTDSVRRPTQDEIFYGEDFDEGRDEFV
tara:strand:- start:264 stop:587 length:324 start_codon:yes stop_codon:yes gene_type:complete